MQELDALIVQFEGIDAAEPIVPLMREVRAAYARHQREAERLSGLIDTKEAYLSGLKVHSEALDSQVQTLTVKLEKQPRNTPLWEL